MLKLNLGCGTKKLDGFVNIDVREAVNPDICMDISRLDRFADNSVDYILAHDVVEHFSHRVIWDVLAEWSRCLKIGGRLEIQVPSIDRIYMDRNKLIQAFDGDSSLRFSQLIFGGQDYGANFHCVCLTYEFFQLFDTKLGLKIVQYFPAIGKYNHAVIVEKTKCI